MCEQLIAALHDAAKEDVHVVVITGSGNVFCSGLDYSCVFDNCYGGHHKSRAKLLVEKFK
jgi:enoyl-CoA hydratase/carnithine racemase